MPTDSDSGFLLLAPPLVRTPTISSKFSKRGPGRALGVVTEALGRMAVSSAAGILRLGPDHLQRKIENAWLANREISEKWRIEMLGYLKHEDFETRKRALQHLGEVALMDRDLGATIVKTDSLTIISDLLDIPMHASNSALILQRIAIRSKGAAAVISSSFFMSKWFSYLNDEEGHSRAHAVDILAALSRYGHTIDTIFASNGVSMIVACFNDPRVNVYSILTLLKNTLKHDSLAFEILSSGAIPKIIYYVSHPRGDIRDLAVETLARLLTSHTGGMRDAIIASNGISRIISCFADSTVNIDFVLTNLAAFAKDESTSLEILSAGAIPKIINCLRHSEGLVRHRAAKLLATLSNHRSIMEAIIAYNGTAMIVYCFNDPKVNNYFVLKTLAAFSKNEHGAFEILESGAIPKLLKCLINGDSRSRNMAMQILRDLSEYDTMDAIFLSNRICMIFKEPTLDVNIVLTLLVVLSKNKHAALEILFSGAVPTLIDCLNYGGGHTRVQAIQILADISRYAGTLMTDHILASDTASIIVACFDNPKLNVDTVLTLLAALFKNERAARQIMSSGAMPKLLNYLERGEGGLQGHIVDMLAVLLSYSNMRGVILSFNGIAKIVARLQASDPSTNFGAVLTRITAILQTGESPHRPSESPLSAHIDAVTHGTPLDGVSECLDLTHGITEGPRDTVESEWLRFYYTYVEKDTVMDTAVDAAHALQDEDEGISRPAHVPDSFDGDGSCELAFSACA